MYMSRAQTVTCTTTKNVGSCENGDSLEMRQIFCFYLHSTDSSLSLKGSVFVKTTDRPHRSPYN